MEGLKQPAELSFEGNVSENWKRFRRNFQNYLLAINLERRDRLQCCYMLQVMKLMR